MGGSRFCRKSLRAYGPWYPFTRGYGALHPLPGLLLVGSFAAAAAAAVVLVDVEACGQLRGRSLRSGLRSWLNAPSSHGFQTAFGSRASDFH